jgi:CheY-like chemotaxis protein
MEDRAFILVAEDQSDDAFLFEHTFAGLGIVDYYIASGGVETIAYLEGAGRFADRQTYPVPDCVLLDLKMPQIDGFEILQWLRSHEDFRLIPTVVLSSSDDPADIRRAYELGANSYFRKRTKIQDTIRLLSLIEEYWTDAKCPKLDPAGKCLM